MTIDKIEFNDPKARSLDIIAENIDQLKTLFPEVFFEGKIDFDVLKQLLGGTIDEKDEKYGLNWFGKRKSRQLALTPSTGTLRPCPEDSVDWGTTQNLIIEGDNLEVLKLLQKSYANKIKLIYIDPPYNTGGDFVYPDNFQESIKNYLQITGQIEGGQRVSSNTEASGRFHTDWLNMMYPRLKLARNLLREDGLIFVSIDDTEIANLKAMMIEIFGEENFEGHIHWRRRHNQPNDPTKMLAIVAEHIIVFARDKIAYRAAGVGKIGITGNFSNPDNDPRGDWSSKPWKVGTDQSGSRYKITTPIGKVFDEDWMGEESTYRSLLEDNRIVFPDKGNGFPRKKYFKFEREQEGQSATNWWSHEQFGHNQGANICMEDLFGKKNVFSNPKPLELISGIISVSNVKDDDIVLDFFAGSGSTAHAVINKNATDNGHRKFILIQLDEPLDPTNSDQKIALDFCDSINKPRNIVEITKERVRRAGKKVRQENPLFPGDIGFRVFKEDFSNIKSWESDSENLQKSLEESIGHLLHNRSQEDILYELLLKLGIDLCVPIEKKNIAGKEVFSIGSGVIFCCLSKRIDRLEVEDLSQGIIQWRQQLNPGTDVTCVFRDEAFVDDVAKSNLVSILQQNSIPQIRSI